MLVELSDVEVRVIGCLVEKELTTPEYYPLTLNALKMACNQKSNREPVLSFDDKTVVRAIESLREKQLALLVTGHGSRVPKYKHTFARRFQLNEKEVAVLCVLMLRSAQTVGELRGRTARMHGFSDLAEVTETLHGLSVRGEGAFVMQLPRQAGRKESRYAHLLSGEPEITEEMLAPPREAAARAVFAEDERIAKLEAEVQELRVELEELKQRFGDFKQQFE